MPSNRQSAPAEYAPFGNVAARNDLQAWIEVPALIRALRLPHGGRVLEVGCGRGIALPVLADRLRPTKLVGLDIDDVLIDAARTHVRDKGASATLVTADVRSMPFDDESFDLVFDFGTCYHVSGGEHGSRLALDEVARVLSPGGLFVHETPVAQHLAHPVRSFGRRLPWASARMLVRERSAVLWSARRKTPVTSPFTPEESHADVCLEEATPV